MKLKERYALRLGFVAALLLSAAGAAYAVTTSAFSKTGTDSDSTAGSWNTQGVLTYTTENDMSGHYYYWPGWSVSLQFTPASNYLDAPVRYRAVIWEDGPGSADTQVWESGPQGSIMDSTVLDPNSAQQGIDFLPSPDRWGVSSNTVFFKIQSGPSPTDLGSTQSGL